MQTTLDLPGAPPNAANQTNQAPLVQNLTRTHFPQLDGLRGYAILFVMIFHLGLDHRGRETPGFLLDCSQLGWMGVDLFFVLSGFLITGILLETKAKPDYLRNFFARRFLRIWPLYYAALLVLFVVVPLAAPDLGGDLQSMLDKQIWFWSYLSNWLFTLEGGFSKTGGGYLWSLAVEEQFYLFWPFVVLTLSHRSLLRLSIGMLCGAFVLRIIGLRFGMNPSALYSMTFTHLDGLAVGACLSVCLRRHEWSNTVAKLTPYVVSLSLAGLVAVRVAAGSWAFWTKPMASVGYTLLALACGGILTLLLRPDVHRAWRSAIENRWLTLTGKYSYALYLVHMPVSSFMKLCFSRFGIWDTGMSYGAAYAAYFTANVLISFGLAFLSWNFFEKPILRLKRHFSYG